MEWIKLLNCIVGEGVGSRLQKRLREYLEHFYIILDIDGNVSYKRLVKKDGKRMIRKFYVNVPEKLNEWGVELERGDNMFPSL